MKTFFLSLFSCLLFLACPTSSQAQWQPTYGPFGGYSVSFHQNDDYIYSVGNRLYRSSDTGHSWHHLTLLGTEKYNCIDLAVHKSTLIANVEAPPTLHWVGKKTLLKSENNGDTWKVIPPPPNTTTTYINLLVNDMGAPPVCNKIKKIGKKS
ncbi:MAG: Photosynthesis system assembly factor, partial [Bacteroidota bacterium]